MAANFCPAAHDAAARTGGGDLRGDFGSESGFVSENDPRFFDRQFRSKRLDDDCLAGFPGEQTDLAFAFRALQTGQRSGFGEADFASARLPIGRAASAVAPAANRGR